MNRWEFWIDVGGTFTDSFGRSPDGTLRHYKVLSSGVVKGALANGSTATRVVDPARAVDPDDLWTGYRLRLLDEQGARGAKLRSSVLIAPRPASPSHRRSLRRRGPATATSSPATPKLRSWPFATCWACPWHSRFHP